jgi:hypothetical protein
MISSKSSSVASRRLILRASGLGMTRVAVAVAVAAAAASRKNNSMHSSSPGMIRLMSSLTPPPTSFSSSPVNKNKKEDHRKMDSIAFTKQSDATATELLKTTTVTAAPSNSSSIVKRFKTNLLLDRLLE